MSPVLKIFRRSALGWLILATAAHSDEVILPAASLSHPVEAQGLSARALGLGGAFVGIADDASSLTWNPAGLAGLDRGEVSFHHNSSLLDGSQESLLLGLPLQGGQALGLGLDWVNYGSFTDRNDQGVVTGHSTAYDLGLKAGWAGTLGSSFQWGFMGGLLTQNLGDSSYTDLSGGLGLTWNPWKPWRLGVSAMNFGADSSGARSDAVIRLGTSYLTDPQHGLSSLLALSTSIEPGGANGFQAGLEERIFDVLALRGGYSQRADAFQVDGLTGLSLGLGVRLADVALDYAYLPEGDLGGSQRISLTDYFDAPDLVKDFGLGYDGPALALQPSFYLGAAAGAFYGTGYDPAKAEAGLRDSGLSGSAPGVTGFSGSFWGGYQFPLGLVLEMGAQIDPARVYSFGVDTGSFQSQTTAVYQDYLLYLLGGYRWILGRNLLTVGGRLQDHVLVGTVQSTSSISGISASSTDALSGSGSGLGPAVRWEHMTGDHVSVGVELGYDYLLTNPDAPDSSTSSGTQNPFDYSGFYGRLTLVGWFSPPLGPPRPRRVRPQPPEDSSDSALQLQFGVPQDWYEAGRKFEEKSQWREAGEAYAQAVKTDPNDSRAWKALGRAQVARGMKDQAIDSFQHYLQLTPGDEETKQWLETYKGK
jgi:hypothetical protein